MKVRDLCLMTICLSILIICSKISISIGIISLTLQTFAVSLIPFLIKWKKSAIVFFVYIVMGLIGIPVFSEGGGFYYVLKPSFGFILGFLLSVFITGSNILNKLKIANLFKGLIGLLVLDFIGLIYMYFILKYYIGKDDINIYSILEIGFLPFILKDSISVVISYIISLRLEPVLNNTFYTNKELFIE